MIELRFWTRVGTLTLGVLGVASLLSLVVR